MSTIIPSTEWIEKSDAAAVEVAGVAGHECKAMYRRCCRDEKVGLCSCDAPGLELPPHDACTLCDGCRYRENLDIFFGIYNNGDEPVPVEYSLRFFARPVHHFRKSFFCLCYLPVHFMTIIYNYVIYII